MFHGVVGERSYSLIMGVFDHCKLFHRHLWPQLEKITEENYLLVIVELFLCRKKLRFIASKWAVELWTSSMLLRERDRDWVESWDILVPMAPHMNHEPRPSTSRNTCIEIIALKLLQFPYLITLEKEDREISWSKRQYYIMHNRSSLGNRRGSFYLKVGRGGEQAKRGKGCLSLSSRFSPSP